jgi:6-phosphogluconate dehydrogenase
MQSILFIMGVSGSGKTTVGKLLSEQTDLPFFDADDVHSTANVEKMKAGIPLTDQDRAAWLQSLNQLAKDHQTRGAVIACSALKETYRQQLADGLHHVQWVYLKGSYALIHERMLQRPHHYFSAAMLQSQFDILEEPSGAWVFDVAEEPQRIAASILKHFTMQSDFGIIGLGVMGKSLALNMAGKGVKLSLYNRYVKGQEEKVAEQFITHNSILKEVKAFEDLSAFVQSLAMPRKILLMVNAGAAVDAVIEELKPLLSKNDIIIDGGNSFYKDTERRIQELNQYGIYFIGAGISGGEEGALKGPSIMPGGDAAAYRQVQPILESIAARDKKGEPCCAYISNGSSGHFVKMVHNAIEYAEMQLLSEVYAVMRNGLQLPPDVIADVFQQWNEQQLSSYLLEITIDILQTKEGEDWLLDKILDTGSSKGTGSWAVAAAAELGLPAGMMTSALYARYLSAQKQTRVQAAAVFGTSPSSVSISTEQLQQAYALARFINHVQGFEFIKAAALKYQWSINCSELARIWTNGCIIRSTLMEQLTAAVSADNLLLHPFIITSIQQQLDSLTQTVTASLQSGMAVPALSEALNYIYAMSTEQSAMNLIQAQRDYFGAHTYQRTDDASGKAYHYQWNNQS